MEQHERVAAAMAAAAPFSPLGLEVDISTVEAVCIGTGRFLRAVLVPALADIGCEVVLAQTRGSSFVEHMARRRPSRTYEVDSVLQDGRVLTNSYPVAAVGSLGDAAGRAAFMELPKRMKRLRYIGLGLTEAGITHNGRSIVDLAEFLHGCFAAGLGAGTGAPLSLINTDNMPCNGDAIRQHVGACDFTAVGPDGRQRALAGFNAWLEQSVVFHNSMVDRITSHREAEADVPRAELLPCKARVVGDLAMPTCHAHIHMHAMHTWHARATHMQCTCHARAMRMPCTRQALVIEDLRGVLPAQLGSVAGVAVRTQRGQLHVDAQLKLRVANGIHTAMVYLMALSGLRKTDGCIGHPLLLPCVGPAPPHRTAPHRMAWHRMASHRMASHRIACIARRTQRSALHSASHPVRRFLPRTCALLVLPPSCAVLCQCTRTAPPRMRCTRAAHTQVRRAALRARRGGGVRRAGHQPAADQSRIRRVVAAAAAPALRARVPIRPP